jgi:hypothetical protein
MSMVYLLNSWPSTDTLLLAKLHPVSFPLFFPNAPFLYQGPTQFHVLFNCHVSLDSTGLWWFFRLSWFLMTWTVLTCTGYFVECLSVETSLMVSHNENGVIDLGRKLKEGKCCAHHTISRVYSTSTTHHWRCWKLDCPVEMETSSSFSHCTVWK